MALEKTVQPGDISPLVFQHALAHAVGRELRADAGLNIVIRLDIAHSVFADEPVHNLVHMGADCGIAVVQLETAAVVDPFSVADKEPVVGKLFRQVTADAHDLRLQPDAGNPVLCSGYNR